MGQDTGFSASERLEWYERVFSLGQLASRESVEKVCQYLMDDAMMAARAQTGYLFLLDQTAEFHCLLARSDKREDLSPEDRHYSETIIRRALEMTAPLILDDATAHPDFGQAKSVIVGQLKSVLVLPLFFEKKAIGAIYLENRDQAAYFSPELLEVLTLFSTQGAVILHGKLDQIDFRRGAERLEKGLHSKNPKMQEVIKQMLAVASTESSVLIQGETGTGKEVLAREIHRQSSRAQRDFVAINCSAIPESLLESELFGYKKGAFTGAASDRQGLIKKADGGSLFLDEIGDLPLHMQAKLLRVLQDKSFFPVGSTQEQVSDFRLIAATHRPLEEAVEQGIFRQDLYFRINTICFELPPLRERSEDLLDLAQEFIQLAANEHKKKVKSLDQAAASALLQQAWPGNIRQLQNAIQRAVVLKSPEEEVMKAEDFQFLSEKSAPTTGMAKLSEAKEEFIKDYVKKAILIHQGNKTKAAKALGVDPKTLYRHLSGK
ncbi:MAG: GAF domain-containing protein [Bradymonadales bacterium]|nr:MAG: GAF domain-containing protein [Bradymonadales bacterium]